MGLKENIEGSVLEDGYNETWDKDASARIETDTKGKRPNNLRRIEAYWEERRLKEQIGEDMGYDDLLEDTPKRGRKGSR